MNALSAFLFVIVSSFRFLVSTVFPFFNFLFNTPFVFAIASFFSV